MNIEHLFVLMIVIFAAVIAISLAVTHRHIKTIYLGINFLAWGVFCHIIGFILYTGIIIDISWVIYFLGNGTFILGTVLILRGLNLFMDKKITYKRVHSVIAFAIVLAFIFYFVVPNLVFRQNLISLIIVYLVFEILYSVINSDEKVRSILKMPIYLFCTLFICLMIARFFIINNNLLLEPIPSQEITYHFFANIIGGILFVILGSMISVIINIRAFNDLKQERQYMEKISITDHLTGLPNRLGLEKYVNNIQDKEKPFAVVMADFDEFKKVNDKYGHIIGDKVIVEFSKILLGINDDHMFTSRYGGDEFVTIVRRYESKEQLREAIERRIKNIGSNIIVNDYVFDLTISVGVAIYPEHGTDIYTLIHKADTALSQIKLNGKNNIKFYELP